MKKFNFLSFIVIMACFFGCTQTSEKADDYDMRRRQVGEYFLSSGVTRYFLPEVPYWANFSEAGSCRRDGVMKFFELSKVRDSLSLNYEQAIQLQLMFNNELRKLKESNEVDHIPFKEEERLFFRVSEQIQAGIRVFRIPKYKKLNLLWIDPLINEGKEKKLKALVNSERFADGHPVFLSLCKSRFAMETWMRKEGLANKNIRLLTYELLTPFSLEGELSTRYHIYLSDLFEEKSIVLYAPRGKTVPKVFEGKYKTKFY